MVSCRVANAGAMYSSTPSPSSAMGVTGAGVGFGMEEAADTDIGSVGAELVDDDADDTDVDVDDDERGVY